MTGLTLGWVGAVSDLALAIVVASVRVSGSTVGQWRAEGPVPTIAFGVVVGAPGLLAVIGLVTNRPVMLAAAAVACLPLAVLSVILIPIWIPGVLWLVAFGRAREARGSLPLQSMGTIVAAACLIVTAEGLLVLGLRPYTYAYAGGSEEGSYIPATHAGAALALVGVDLAVTTLLASRGTRSNGYPRCPTA